MAKNDPAPAVSKLIVEGEPVNTDPNAGEPDVLASHTADDSSPQPVVKEIADRAEEKLEAASGGFTAAQAKQVLAATDAEPLWVPDNEKLSVYANPIAKETHDAENAKNDHAGVGV